MGNKKDSSLRDLTVVVIITVLVLILSHFFDVFNFIISFINKHPSSINYIDETVTVLFTLTVSLGVYSWRRWRSLKKETAERIKLQEELIRMAKTEAETERIVSRQLESEIQLRKVL